MTNFSPREIVSELDRYIVGQDAAKRAVAIALRNRWRRQQLSEDLREEVLPKEGVFCRKLISGDASRGKNVISTADIVDRRTCSCFFVYRACLGPFCADLGTGTITIGFSVENDRVCAENRRKRSLGIPIRGRFRF